MLLDIAENAPRRDIGKRQAARAIAPENRARIAAKTDKLLDPVVVGAPREPHAKRTFAQAGLGRAPDRARVAIRPATQNRVVQLVMDRVMHHPDHHLPLVDASNDHAPLRNSVDEIGRAINRIYHPGVAGDPDGGRTFLADDGIVRKRLCQPGAHRQLDIPVRFRDKILMALGLDRKLRPIAKIAERHLPRLGGDVAGGSVAGVQFIGRHGFSLWQQLGSGRAIQSSGGGMATRNLSHRARNLSHPDRLSGTCPATRQGSTQGFWRIRRLPSCARCPAPCSRSRSVGNPSCRIGHPGRSRGRC